MEKRNFDVLPNYNDVVRPWKNRPRRRRSLRLVAILALLYFGYSAYTLVQNTTAAPSLLDVERLNEDLEYCKTLQRVAKDPSGTREVNKRWNSGIKSTLIRNASVWTGEPSPGTSIEDARAGKGYAWIQADVLLSHGLIQKLGPNIASADVPEGTEVFDAKGRPLTAGIVDMHSHGGLGVLANLDSDDNELSNDITPYVKSLDGLNPLHPELQWIKSGGVTTSLILPGSGNNMGGEAFVIKLAVGQPGGRTEISQEDLFADPDKNWRYMKMACGENAKRVYGRVGSQGPFSRLGEAWEFRHAFEQARDYVRKQDDWCSAAQSAGVEKMPSYLPQELRWESLGALLRGQIRLNTHCYTIADLESFVRHTNEFKFQLRAFHHAHQTYIVPEVLKRAYGGTPAAALFFDNSFYKVEAYTASERAGKILYDAGVTPVYVSDNPVLNSQHVIFEAAKAYTSGLPYHAALASVTSASAELLGLGERVGKIKPGFDADVVVWDSDPLSVGATPLQVWVDGAPQFEDTYEISKPAQSPIQPDESLAQEFTRKEGKGSVIFTGIREVLHPGLEQIVSDIDSPTFNVVVSEGSIACVGECSEEFNAGDGPKAQVINLKNGYITAPFAAFGSSLGLLEIDAVRDTHDGDPSKTFSRAVDGLALDGKQLEMAFNYGVTLAISAPSEGGISAQGVSVGFRTGASNALKKGAVWADEVAAHYTLSLDAKDDKTPSISSAVGALRKKLLEAISEFGKNETKLEEKYGEKSYLHRVVVGSLPLVITVHSADTIAAIVRMKSDVEEALSNSKVGNTDLRLILLGGAESHLVSSELAAANIAVVLAPLLPHAASWDQRRSLTGAPLTNGTTIDKLLNAGVKVAIGVDETWMTRELGWLAGWAARNHEGGLSKKKALALVGSNIYEMLGLAEPDAATEWVLWEGNPLEVGRRIRAVGSNGEFKLWV